VALFDSLILFINEAETVTLLHAGQVFLAQVGEAPNRGNGGVIRLVHCHRGTTDEAEIVVARWYVVVRA
jgi:hypothetical protein